MKTREGLVSNSSSSSFVVNKQLITPIQAMLIIHHEEVAKWLDHEDLRAKDAWSVYDNGLFIRLDTWMDNFDMELFLQLIGVPETAVIKEE